jgi:hypothetical protein
MLNGEFDVAAVFGPFAGWVKTMKGEPITILPVNMMDDEVPLEFELGLGVRRTDAFLKYMIEFALEDHEADIEKILKDYGVPLVQCSKCIVPGDLPAHGTYTQVAQTGYKARPDLASPDQVVTKEKLEGWLADGADPTQELSNAIVANDQDRVKFLVEKGADVNTVDNQGGTPLTAAARQRHDKMVELLIKLGADVNKPNSDGMTPLTTAVMRDHVPSVKVLLANGANVEEPGPEGFRPLAVAIAEDKYEVAKALMEGGADVNAKSKSGATALMVAATHNNPPMIGLLIEAGADTEAKNNQGKTAAEVAELNQHMEAAQAIRVLATAKSAAGVPAAAPEGGQGTTSQ